MVRGMSVLALIGVAVGMAACTSGPSWDGPGRTIPVEQKGEVNSMTAPPAGRVEVGNGDRPFAAEAAAGGAYEIQSSQMALQKSQDSKVRMIAQHMIDDHTAAGKRLDGIVAMKGWVVNDAPNGDQQVMISKLNEMSGMDFNQEYLSQQKMAHEQTIALFKKEIDSGIDADFRGFAGDSLPTIQAHYQMITGNGGM